MVSISIDVDDEEIQSSIDQLIHRLGDLRSVFSSIGEYMVRSTEDRFQTQQTPEGQPWAPLSASTLAQKKNSKILTETGRLRGSIVYQVIANKVVVGANVKYAQFHQLGTKPYVILPQKKKALYWKGARHPVRKVNHPGLPPRPFLGVSEADRAEISAIIGDFLS